MRIHSPAKSTAFFLYLGFKNLFLSSTVYKWLPSKTPYLLYLPPCVRCYPILRYLILNMSENWNDLFRRRTRRDLQSNDFVAETAMLPVSTGTTAWKPKRYRLASIISSVVDSDSLRSKLFFRLDLFRERQGFAKICNFLSVADPEWYSHEARSGSGSQYSEFRIPTRIRFRILHFFL